MPEPYPVALTLGFLLAAALVAGLIASSIRLPRVTAYLLVGLLLGASVLPEAYQWLQQDDIEIFHPIGELAMAMVLFAMGSEFTLYHFRRILPRVTRLSLGELSATIVLVACGLLFVGETWEVAVLLGVLALATAPATTVLVLKESQSDGPVTDFTVAMVAINNLVCVILFEVLLFGIEYAEGRSALPVYGAVGNLFRDLVLSTLLGVAAGVVISYACGLLGQNRWFIMLVAISTLLLGICGTFHYPYLLTFLAMGVTVANTSSHVVQIREELNRFTGLLCVVFFVIHGAELNLQALLAAGVVGSTYIAMRSAGKYLGVFAAASLAKEGKGVRNWLGSALLSQAGAAIALSAIAIQRDPPLGKHLMNIILGTVVFFEIVGPLLIRNAVLRAGEIPFKQAIYHTTTTAWEELQHLIDNVRTAFGRKQAEEVARDTTVFNIMRKDVRSVRSSASFKEVVDFIEHSHDNTFPVVNDERVLTGVIRYSDLSDTLFDPGIANLVKADDLAVPAWVVLYPDQPLVEACHELDHTLDDCIPVVTREEPHKLVGLIKRSEALRWMFELRTRAAEDEVPL